MEIAIFASRDCHHRSLLEKYLQSLQIPYEVKFIEEHPGEARSLGIDHSPALLIDETVAFDSMPSYAELRKTLESLQ